MIFYPLRMKNLMVFLHQEFILIQDPTVTPNGVGPGVQVQWVDKNGVVWDSSYGTGDQTGSSFKILSLEYAPDAAGRYYLKVKMQFNCKLYKEGTFETKVLTNGESVFPFGPK